MKRVVRFILWMITIASCYAGFTVMWPEIHFEWLTTNGDSEVLVISWTKIYKQELIWVYAYLSAWPATVTASASTWYPISWTFVNEYSNGFVASGSDMIVYQWNQRRMRFVMSWYGTTDTNGTILDIWVKINGNVITGSIAGWRLATATDRVDVLSISQAVLSSWDTVQLVIRSDEAGAELTPDTVVTYASSFY